MKEEKKRAENDQMENLNGEEVVVIRREERGGRVKVGGGAVAAFTGRREERVNRLQSDKE